MNKSVSRMLGWLALLTLALGLSGCLVPEKFNASAVVHPDGSYTYKYDGTAAHIFAVAAIQQKGSLPSSDEAKMKDAAQKEAAKPGVKKFAYLGGGKFDVSLEREIKIGKAKESLDLVSMTQDKSGVFVATSPELKEQDRTKLQALGIVPSGEVSITLPPGAIVLSHNASSVPGVFNKAYTWKIGSYAQRPELKFKMPN